jgi:hypothetical protein
MKYMFGLYLIIIGNKRRVIIKIRPIREHVIYAKLHED